MTGAPGLCVLGPGALFAYERGRRLDGAPAGPFAGARTRERIWHTRAFVGVPVVPQTQR